MKFFNEDPRPNPFTDSKPGETWFKLFMKRYPSIAVRQAEFISRNRGALTEGCIRGWFRDARDFFQNVNSATKNFNNVLLRQTDTVLFNSARTILLGNVGPYVQFTAN